MPSTDGISSSAAVLDLSTSIIHTVGVTNGGNASIARAEDTQSTGLQDDEVHFLITGYMRSGSATHEEPPPTVDSVLGDPDCPAIDTSQDEADSHQNKADDKWASTILQLEEIEARRLEIQELDGKKTEMGQQKEDVVEL